MFSQQLNLENISFSPIRNSPVILRYLLALAMLLFQSLSSISEMGVYSNYPEQDPSSSEAGEFRWASDWLPQTTLQPLFVSHTQMKISGGGNYAKVLCSACFYNKILITLDGISPIITRSIQQVNYLW